MSNFDFRSGCINVIRLQHADSHVKRGPLFAPPGLVQLQDGGVIAPIAIVILITGASGGVCLGHLVAALLTLRD